MPRTDVSSLDLVAIRLALHTELSKIDGLYVYKVPPSTPSIFPCALIYPPQEIDWKKTAKLDMATYELLVLVGRAAPDNFATLEAYMSGTGDKSIIKTLYANPTLDNTISNLRLPNLSTGIYSVSRSSGEDVLGVEFNVEVMA